jgi:hypothetical protein
MINDSEEAFEIGTKHLLVAACRSDAASVTLEFRSHDEQWTLRLEGSFSITHADEAKQRIAELIGESVLLLRAYKVGAELEVMFSHGWFLKVESDPDYEAWGMYSAEGERLIAVPGNGVAMWGKTVRP